MNNFISNWLRRYRPEADQKTKKPSPPANNTKELSINTNRLSRREALLLFLTAAANPIKALEDNKAETKPYTLAHSLLDIDKEYLFLNEKKSVAIIDQLINDHWYNSPTYIEEINGQKISDLKMVNEVIDRLFLLTIINDVIGRKSQQNSNSLNYDLGNKNLSDDSFIYLAYSVIKATSGVDISIVTDSNDRLLLAINLGSRDELILDPQIVKPDHSWKQNRFINKKISRAGDFDYVIHQSQLDKPKILAPYQIRSRYLSKLTIYTKNDPEKLEILNGALSLDSKNPDAFLQIADLYHGQKKYQDALGFYEDAQKLKANFKADNYINKADCWLNETPPRYKEAFDEYDNALKLDPTRADIYLQRGKVALVHNPSNRNAAIKDYDKAIRLNPKLDDAYYQRSLSYYQSGRNLEALNDIYQAYKLDPDKYWPLIIDSLETPAKVAGGATVLSAIGAGGYLLTSKKRKLEASLKNRDYKKALELCNKLIRSNPKNIRALYIRGIIHKEQGKFQKALEDFLKITKIDNLNSESYFQAGLCEYNRKEMNSAKYYFQASYRCNNRNTEAKRYIEFIEQNDESLAQQNLGEKALQADKYNDATKYFTKAVALDNNNLASVHKLTRCYEQTNRLELAIETLQESLEKHSNNEGLLDYLAFLLHQQANYQEALKTYHKLIEINPQHVEGLNGVGACYHELGKYQKSLEYFNKAINRDPQYYFAHSNLGKSYRNLKLYDIALSSLDKAIKVKPNAALAYVNRGDLFFDTRFYDLAIDDFLRAIELDPTCESLTNLANCYFKQNKFKEAEKYYLQSLESKETSHTLNYFSEYLASQGRHNEAIDKAKRSIELVNKEPNTCLEVKLNAYDAYIGVLSSLALKNWGDLGPFINESMQLIESIETRNLQNDNPTNEDLFIHGYVSAKLEQVKTNYESNASSSGESFLESNSEEFQGLEDELKKLEQEMLGIDHSKQYTKALRNIDEALNYIPGNIRALKLRSKLNAKLGNVNQQINDIQKIIELNIDNDNSELDYELGELLIDLEPEKSEEYFIKAIQADSMFAKIYERDYMQGNAQPRQKIVSAIRSLRNNTPRIKFEDTAQKRHKKLGNKLKEVNKTPQTIEKEIYNSLERGNDLYKQGNYLHAIDEYQKIIDLNAKDEMLKQAYGGLGNCYNELWKYPEALENYNKLVNLDPSPLALKSRSLLLKKCGYHEEAIEDFKRLLSKDKDAVDIYYALIDSLSTINRINESIRYCDELLRVKPDHFGATFSKAALNYLGKQNYQDAILGFNKSIETKPKHTRSYLFRALSYQALGKDALAFDDFKAFFENANPVSDYLDHLAEKIIKLEDIDSIREALETIKDSEKAATKTCYLYFKAFFSLKKDYDYNIALDYINQLLEKNPHNSYALKLRAEIYDLIGEYGKRVQDLETLVKHNPESAWSHNQLARAYDTMNHTDKAQKHYLSAMKFLPKVYIEEYYEKHYQTWKSASSSTQEFAKKMKNAINGLEGNLIDEDFENQIAAAFSTSSGDTPNPSDQSSTPGATSLEQYEKELQNAIDAEDYEKAAKLRDKIDRLKEEKKKEE